MWARPPGGPGSVSARLSALPLGFFRRRAAAGNGGTAMRRAAAV